MNEHDIEKLMAYADGEIDPTSAQEVERLLQDDEEARATVERFRQTRAALAPGMDELLKAPVPQHLVDAIRSHRMAPARPVAQPGTPTTHPVERLAANDRAFWPSLATAASLALVVGLFAGQWWASPMGGESPVAQSLQQAMETLPAGEALDVAGVQITPVTSYRDADGKVCREFEQAADGRVALGIACRNETQWVMRFMVEQGPLGAVSSAPTFAPASGEADPVAALINDLKLGVALSAEEERTAIEQGWKLGR